MVPHTQSGHCGGEEETLPLPLLAFEPLPWIETVMFNFWTFMYDMFPFTVS
jgi:hypothetical protein